MEGFEFGLNTRTLLAGTDPEQWQNWDLVTPISNSVVFKQAGPTQSERFLYSRFGNPTRKVLEGALAKLDHGNGGLVFSSGSAASVAAVHLLTAGDHIIAMDDLYVGTMMYLSEFISRMQIKTTFVDATDINNVSSAIQKNTKMIWLESASNPKLKIPDIQKICDMAHGKNQGILVVVDNTFLTHCILRPLDLGADICLMSCTKYVNGHHDVLMGSITTKSLDLHKKLLFNQQTLGAVPSATDCSQVMRSLKTLPLRMERHLDNGLLVAKFLESNPRIEHVYHPLLASHPQNKLALTQNNGRFSGMVSFILSGNAQNVEKLLQSLKVCILATSLGGAMTTIAVIGSMSGDGARQDVATKRSLGSNFLRVSVGLEDIEDILADLKQAIDKAFQ